MFSIDPDETRPDWYRIATWVWRLIILAILVWHMAHGGSPADLLPWLSASG